MVFISVLQADRPVLVHFGFIRHWCARLGKTLMRGIERDINSPVLVALVVACLHILEISRLFLEGRVRPNEGLVSGSINIELPLVRCDLCL
jgi:hypothetical protein